MLVKLFTETMALNSKSLLKRCDNYFQISDRGSSFRTEILAGLSLYLSLAYILILNPSILAQAGFNTNSVLFATAVASGLTTILMGVWARLPFALAPGLEMNGFVAFSAISVMGLSIGQALGAVFWSGALCLLLTWLPVRSKIIAAIPASLQSNLAFSVGIFVLTIGLFLSKIVLFTDGAPSSLGNIFSPEAQCLYLGLFICCLLRSFNSKKHKQLSILSASAFLIAIVASAVFARLQGITVQHPSSISIDMLSGIGLLDWFPFTSPEVLTVFIVLFLIDFYGSIGKFIGLTAATNLRSKENAGVIGMEKAMYVDGIGTIGGALVGTTSIITYVESAIGIHAGGRTGIVAITCGLLMILSLIFTPLMALIPVVATSGVLIYVGYALIPKQDLLSGNFSRFDLAIGILMALVSFFTFSLDKAMLLGFGAYALKQLLAKDEKPNLFLIGSFLLLLLSFGIQSYLK